MSAAHVKLQRRLADRLATTQHSFFVGRAAELELFHSAVTAPEPPFAVLHICGPGGVGKTTLLREYVRLAKENDVFTVYLDGRSADPSPPGFLSALSAALPDAADPLQALSRHARILLLIDTYERLNPLDGWLRDVFLPQLPSASVTVIAGRNPPDSAWRTAPGWRDLTRILSLRNLHPDESRAFLNARGIPDARQQPAMQFTHGHPLALALVADVLHQTGEAVEFDPRQAPDVVRSLLERFVDHAPTLQHRQALDLCAHVRMTTEALLAEVFGAQAGHDLFDWLFGLSFIEHDAEGIFPHDLARDVLDADFRWRNPEAYQAMHRQVRDSLLQRLKHDAQPNYIFDLLYLHRNNPVAKHYFMWSSFGAAYAEPATARDQAAILTMIRRHEGEESARCAHHWLQWQPEAFVIIRERAGDVIGFAATLAIQDATPADREADPAVAAALRFVERHSPLRHGEVVFYQRLWMDAEAYQSASTTQDVVAMLGVQKSLAHSNKLAWWFDAVADVTMWAPFYDYLGFQHIEEADFTIGGRRYAVFGHDARVRPVAEWLDMVAARESAATSSSQALETAAPPPLLALSQSEFAQAVRQALRDFVQPRLLSSNPLLRSRAVAQAAQGQASPSDLQALIREAAETLRASPKTEKFYRALLRTYLEPAPTQEIAAELLDLPFGTYRHHLNRAIAHVTEWLWQRELYG